MKLKQRGDAREFDIEISGREAGSMRLRIDGEELTVALETTASGGAIISLGGRRIAVRGARTRDALLVTAGPNSLEFVTVEQRAGRARGGLAAHEVTAPMPGKVLQVLVAEGELVAHGQPLIVLEAMKMETTLYAESLAMVKKIHAGAGAMVDHGAVLMEFSAAPAQGPSTSESPAPES